MHYIYIHTYIHTELEMGTTGFEFRYDDISFRKTITEYLNETDFLGITVSSCIN